ncbi:MAG: hypothetical protein KIB43_10070 [Clostridium baratii]|uniref:hypothetical protein n=1 Tax=Clostridium baratii TaxID=1561 RepID=UPI002430F341|nr:hypothetical protein [Clostridium baratii]MBS6007293.1 hypothetical protein [Clostridium baratii]
MVSKYVKSKKTNQVKSFANSKTDYGIPTFGFKSSLVIMLGAVISTFIVPYILSFIGIDFKTGVILGNATITSYALAYSRYFIETKKKYPRNVKCNSCKCTKKGRGESWIRDGGSSS